MEFETPLTMVCMTRFFEPADSQESLKLANEQADAPITGTVEQVLQGLYQSQEEVRFSRAQVWPV